MNKLINIIKEEVSNSFLEAGFDNESIKIFESSKKELGQFQCNDCLNLAKKYKTSPLDIANKIKSELDKSDIFSDVNIAGPGFINLSVKKSILIKLLNELYLDKELGLKKASQPEKIVLDYGGPNVAKPLHVGHLRSAIIGESIKRLLREAGHEVIGDIHLGDFGLPMGLTIAYIEKVKPFLKEKSQVTKKDLEITQQDLESWYPSGAKLAKEDKDFYKKGSTITNLIQKKDEKYYNIWKIIRDVSIGDIKKINDRIKVSYDLWQGESDAYEYIEKTIDKLKKEKILYKSDEALVVDVEKEDDTFKVPPIIVKKSDGGYLYSTTDLAKIYKRDVEIKPNKIYYLTDNRQSLHFLQVFRCAKKGRLVSSNLEFDFFGFGTMNGKNNKPFKTRDGSIYKLENLLNDVEEVAKEKLKHLKYGKKEKEKIAKKVSIAAIKFGDLINFRQKDYIFDAKRFLSFEGKTGPYILYSLARINSIIEKTGLNSFDDYNFLTPQNREEEELVLKLFAFNNSFQNAINEKAPNYIGDYVYNLCVLLNKFYSTNKIISNQNKEVRESWIKLLWLTSKVIKKNLNLLSIPYLEKM